MHFSLKSHRITCTLIPKMNQLALLLVSILILPLFSTIAQDNDLEAHKTVIRAVYEQAISAGDVEILQDALAPDYVNQGLGTNLDADGFETYITSLRTAMPDLEATIEVLIAEDEWAASRVLLTGTFENEWVLDDEIISPNQEPIAWTLITVHHFDENGQIAEDFTSYDELDLRIQLDASPLPRLITNLLPTREYVPAIMEEEQSTGLEAQEKETFQHVIEDAINNGDLTAIDIYMPGDYLTHEPFGDFTSAQFRLVIAGFRTIVPDLEVYTEVMIAEGNWLAAHLIYTGTFSEDIAFSAITIPANNEPIRFVINVFVHFDDEGIGLEDFKEYNRLAWLQQLGILPIDD